MALSVLQCQFDRDVSESRAQDMRQYLRETHEMVRQGMYKEALQRYIWYHDHVLEYEPSQSAVRLSFALGSWKRLGDVYPPARQALAEMRDHKTLLIRKGEANTRLFADVKAINRIFEEETKTIELFEYLDREHPQLAKQCWFFARDDVISARRIDFIQKYLGNPVREFARVKEQTADSFVWQTLPLIEAALALGDEKAAREIQSQALALFDDDRLRDAVKAK